MTTSLNFSNSGNSYDPEAAADEFQYFLELSDRQHLLPAPAPATDEWPELDADGNLPLEEAAPAPAEVGTETATEIDGMAINEWNDEYAATFKMVICHDCWERMEPGQKFVSWYDHEYGTWLVVHLDCWEKWTEFVKNEIMVQVCDEEPRPEMTVDRVTDGSESMLIDTDYPEPQDFYEPGERARYYDHDYMGYGPSEDDGPDGYEEEGEGEGEGEYSDYDYRPEEHAEEEPRPSQNWSGHPLQGHVCDHCGCEFVTLEALHDHQANDYADCDGQLTEFQKGVIFARYDNYYEPEPEAGRDEFTPLPGPDPKNYPDQRAYEDALEGYADYLSSLEESKAERRNEQILYGGRDY